MGWPRQQKRNTRQRILESAARLFSRHGFDNVSIGDVMRGAGLTHGSFYTHFRSKQALYAEAVATAARASALARLLEEGKQRDLQQLLAGYLDIAHVRQEPSPCPLAFLATDVATREQEVRGAYTRVFRRLVAFLRHGLSPRPAADARERAMAVAALMIGGVAVSRALDDEATAEALLAACRRFGGELLGAAPE